MSIINDGNVKGNPSNTDDFLLPDLTFTQKAAALFYAEKLCWPVFPCKTDGKDAKKPLIKAWQENASTDPGQIKKWWDRWPDAAIGAPRNHESGISVIDLDNKKDLETGLTGLKAFEELEEEFNGGEEIEAVVVHTPNGGDHLYVSHGSLPFGKTESRVAPNVDTRCSKPDGSSSGYVILPPSKIENRRGKMKPYKWAEGSGLSSLRNPPDAPEWLAYRACFDKHERMSIECDYPEFREKLSDIPRAEWGDAFERHKEEDSDRKDRENEARQREIRREDANRERYWCDRASEPVGGLTLDDPYIAKAIEDELDKLRTCTTGQNAQLNDSAFALGSLLAGMGFDKPGDDPVEEARAMLFETILSVRNTDRAYKWDSKAGREAAIATIASGLNAGLAKPRDLSGISSTGSSTSNRNSSANAPSKGPTRKANIIPFSMIEERKLEWLWEGRFPLGKFSILGGQPDQGKSQVALDVAARVTTGAPFPREVHRRLVDKSNNETRYFNPERHCKEEEWRTPGRVIIIACEDDSEDTIRPRLEVAGADMDRVLSMDGSIVKNEDGSTSLEFFSVVGSIDELDDYLTAHPDVQMILIDPISAYLEGKDTHKTGEVRSALLPLQKLLQKHKIAGIAIMHFNKDTKGSPLDRISGSGAFTAVARAAYYVVEHPDNQWSDEIGEKRRLFVPAKNNLAAGGKSYGLSYVIKTAYTKRGNETSRVFWYPERDDTTIGEALSGKRDSDNALDNAEIFLSSQLAAGARKSDAIKRAALQADIKMGTLERAKKKLGVKVTKGRKREDPWTWSLPGKSDDPE